MIQGIDLELSHEGIEEHTAETRLRYLRAYMREQKREGWRYQETLNREAIERFFEAYPDLPDERIKIVFQLHGYLQTPHIWREVNAHIERANQRNLYGQKILPLPLGYYFFKKIDTNGRSIARQIRETMHLINRRAGRELHQFAAVGHSKGGIILNMYMKNRLFEKVAPASGPFHVSHVVCVASPHNGTYAALIEDLFRAPCLGLGIRLTGGRELKPYSDFLKRIHSLELPGLDDGEAATAYTIVRAGIFDYMVFNRFTHPHSMGRLEDWLYALPGSTLLFNSRKGASQSRINNYSERLAIPQVRRCVLDQFGHLAPLFSEEGIRCMLANVGVEPTVRGGSYPAETSAPTDRRSWPIGA